MTAPSIKEALERQVARIIEPAASGYTNEYRSAEDKAARIVSTVISALATFQPDGERREAIARIIDPIAHSAYDSCCRHEDSNAEYWLPRVEKSREIAAAIIASGLVQNEAGWRTMDSAPKDGKPVLIYVPINQPDRRVLTAYWTESEWWICSGSVVLGKPTNWKPLPTPPAIHSARDGGAS